MAIVKCPRCQKPCQEAKPANPDARPLKRSTLKGGGMCLECAVTSFLLCLPSGRDFPTEALLAPHIQAQMAAAFKVGNSEAAVEDIDWPRVIELWQLPFPKRLAKDHY